MRLQYFFIFSFYFLILMTFMWCNTSDDRMYNEYSIQVSETDETHTIISFARYEKDTFHTGMTYNNQPYHLHEFWVLDSLIRREYYYLGSQLVKYELPNEVSEKMKLIQRATIKNSNVIMDSGEIDDSRSFYALYNPEDSILSVSVPGEFQQFDLLKYDSSGRLIESETFEQKHVKIRDMENWEAFCIVSGSDGHKTNYKFLKVEFVNDLDAPPVHLMRNKEYSEHKK